MSSAAATAISLRAGTAILNGEQQHHPQIYWRASYKENQWGTTHKHLKATDSFHIVSCRSYQTAGGADKLVLSTVLRHTKDLLHSMMWVNLKWFNFWHANRILHMKQTGYWATMEQFYTHSIATWQGQTDSYTSLTTKSLHDYEKSKLKCNKCEVVSMCGQKLLPELSHEGTTLNISQMQIFNHKQRFLSWQVSKRKFVNIYYPDKKFNCINKI